MSFKVLVTSDFDQMSDVAARIYVRKVNEAVAKKGQFVGILPTGNSPVGLYSRLAAWQDRFDAKKMVTFNLDEYVGLPGDNPQERAMHPESYCTFMAKNLFTNLSPTISKTHVPCGSLIDQGQLEKSLAKGKGDYELQGANVGKAIVIAENAKDDYLKWIKKEILDGYLEKIGRFGGSVDVALVGVGGRGHIAFHESGIPLDLKMLLVKLDDNTVKNAVADGHFATKADSPRFAVSMGSGGVCSLSQCILLVANGPRKTKPIAESLLAKVSSDVPISVCQDFSKKGGEVIFVLDEAAAQGILSEGVALKKKSIEVRDLRP